MRCQEIDFRELKVAIFNGFLQAKPGASVLMAEEYQNRVVTGGLYTKEEGKVGVLFSLSPYTTHLDRFEVFSNDIKSLDTKISGSGILS